MATRKLSPKVAARKKSGGSESLPGRRFVDSLRLHLQDESAGSFQLMGEPLWLLTGPDLVAASEAYIADLRREVPPALRARFEQEQSGIVDQAMQWNRRYNISMNRRVQGYLRLGQICRFEYPWPVVAILGICQVMEGESQANMMGLVAQAIRRAGYRLFDEFVDGSKDVLRRTNRGIFADSVPTVLYALRCHDLRASGEESLAAALLRGPLPPLMDEESRALATYLYEGLAIGNSAKRFEALSRLTLRHFSREQKIFTYNMGARIDKRPKREGEPRLTRVFTDIRKVPAPAVERRMGRRKVVFKPYVLPRGFDMRDHRARVEEFGKAFVEAVTLDLVGYRTAATYVQHRFGSKKNAITVDYPSGGAGRMGQG